MAPRIPRDGLPQRLPVGSTVEWTVPPKPVSPPTQVVEWEVTRPEATQQLSPRNVVEETVPQRALDFEGKPRAIDPFKKAPKRAVSVLSYNLKNLFPAKDQGFLFLSDEEQQLERKRAGLAGVIRSVNGGRGPDILAFTEASSLEHTAAFVDDQLYEMGYRTVVQFDTSDRRGIDPAVVTRFPLAGEPILHSVRAPDGKPLRGILQVDVQTDEEVLTVLVNHWPSKLGGERAATLREQCGRRLRELCEQILAQHPGRPISMLGDFNAEHHESAFGPRGLDVSPTAARAHQRNGVYNTTEDLKRAQPEVKGTLYYEGFAHLDHHLVSATALDEQGLQYRQGHSVVVQTEGNSRPFKPRGASHPVSRPDEAISDHWPVYTLLVPADVDSQPGFWASLFG